MSFPNILHISEAETFNTYTTEKVPVGSLARVEDGRVFRFSEVGATALVVNDMNQGEAPLADGQTEVVGTLAAGVTVLTGVGATTADYAINSLKYGYVHTDNATTLPIMRIKSNTLLDAGAATGTITLFVPTPTAIAAGNTISYIKNPWRDVIQGVVTTPTAVPTGVCRVAAAADGFCWLQTAGVTSVLYDSTTTAIAAVGDPVQTGVAAGAVGGIPTVGITQIVGHLVGMVEATTESILVNLCID